jgi:prepilin-type N-terminal cleavage/methylation domain-containing protein
MKWTGRGEESGFTLIELVVTAGVIAIASMALFSFLEGTSNVTARVEKSVATEEGLQVALRTITSDLRGASVLSACTSIDYRTCVTIDIPRSSGTTACPARRMRYWLTAGTLYQARTDYAAGCATSTVVAGNRPLLTNVTSSGTVFRYYDRNGTAIDPLTTPANIPSSASVLVTLKAASGARNAPDITLSAPAALRNNR